LRERFGISGRGALLGYDDLVIDPRETTLALLRASITAGARVIAPARIVEINAKKSGVTAIAANGRRIHARHAVFATGYELPKGVHHPDHQLVSTWAIATISQKRRLWPGECMIWEASKPYLYLRTTSDGRVVCGGEDEDFSDETRRDALLPQKTVTLQRKLGSLLPGVSTQIAFAWCGTFGSSRTGLPTIGRIPHLPSCWIALGYGGNGTTYARIAADVIAGALLGSPDSDAELYAFTGPRNWHQ
jgi:glycine/D-amino acid oxidase-like deaminating enzyme